MPTRPSAIRFALSLLVGVLVAGGVSAQFPDDLPSTEEIESRITQLKNSTANLPQVEYVLYEELRKHQEELLKYRKVLATIARTNREQDESTKRIQDVRPEAKAALENLKVVLAKAQPTKDEQEKVAREVYRVRPPDFDFDSPWNRLPNPVENESPDQLKKRLKDIDQSSQDLDSYFDKQKAASKQRKEERAGLADQIQKQLIPVLEDHLKKLNEKGRSFSANDFFKGNVFIIIILLGLFSLGTIVIVRIFPHDIQKDWVGSGQVIQFVTVMILLSVIMALGLLTFLTENTLGTLLGGIAGYILAQGVNRSAQGLVKTTAATPTSPAITSVHPNTAPVAGGTTVTIAGSGFDIGAKVKFGGLDATNFQVVAGTVTVTAPAQKKAGVVDVQVINPNGQTATLRQTFTYT